MRILCNNYEKRLVFLKPHDSVQRPRVSRYNLNTFLCIFWNFSGVLHDKLLEMSLMVIPYVKYRKLIKVANEILLPLRQAIGKLQAFTFGRKRS